MELRPWPTMKPQRKPNEIRPLKGVILTVDVATGVCAIDRLEEYGLKCPNYRVVGSHIDPPEHPELNWVRHRRMGRQLAEAIVFD